MVALGPQMHIGPSGLSLPLLLWITESSVDAQPEDFVCSAVVGTVSASAMMAFVEDFQRAFKGL